MEGDYFSKRYNVHHGVFSSLHPSRDAHLFQHLALWSHGLSLRRMQGYNGTYLLPIPMGIIRANGQIN